MAKTEVYSWRVDPEFKMALEFKARLQGMTLAEALDRLAKSWLEMPSEDEGEATQRRLRAVVARYAGAISGDDPYGSERVREVVRKRVRERNAH